MNQKEICHHSGHCCYFDHRFSSKTVSNCLSFLKILKKLANFTDFFYIFALAIGVYTCSPYCFCNNPQVNESEESSVYHAGNGSLRS